MFATDSNPERGNNRLCAAYGCALPGGVSLDRGPGARFYCRWHLRLSVDQYDLLSSRINARFDLFRAAVERRETAELPAKPDEAYHDYLTRLDAECRKVAFERLAPTPLAPALAKAPTAADGWRLAAHLMPDYPETPA